MVAIYYESDQVVVDDQELQDFVKDVYVYGMRGKKASGRAHSSIPPDPSSAFSCTSDFPWACDFHLST